MLTVAHKVVFRVLDMPSWETSFRTYEVSEDALANKPESDLRFQDAQQGGEDSREQHVARLVHETMSHQNENALIAQLESNNTYTHFCEQLRKMIHSFIRKRRKFQVVPVFRHHPVYTLFDIQVFVYCDCCVQMKYDD